MEIRSSLKKRFPDQVLDLLFQALPHPVNFGWEEDDDGNLEMRWNTVLPASEEILELMFCSCTKQCVAGKCPCIDNGLFCTDACKKKNCDNFPDEDVVDLNEYVGEEEFDENNEDFGFF